MGQRISMKPIYIPHLTQKLNRTAMIEFEDFIPDLETLTPVRGSLRVTHQGNYLEVAAEAEAIVTLTCDRCLQQFNHRLAVDASEIIWLDVAANQQNSAESEVEVSLEDLVETIGPDGYFGPQDWLYQQLCLALPLRNLCDRRCPGIQIDNQASEPEIIDQRWASLANLKGQIKP